MVLACKLEDEHDDEDNHVKQIDEAWQWIYQKYMQWNLKSFVMKFCNFAICLISLMITKVFWQWWQPCSGHYEILTIVLFVQLLYVQRKLTTKFEKLNDEIHKTLHFAHQTRNKQWCTNKIKK
jgi:hypothetical protein